MKIDRLDHLVLTVQDIDATVEFYTRVLGMEAVTFGEGRRALTFGHQKINLHPAERPLQPHALHPTSGSADLCLVLRTPLGAAIAELEAVGVPIEMGPVARTGATGEIRSIYVRDPDQNLIELSEYV